LAERSNPTCYSQRKQSNDRAIEELADLVDSHQFEESFGASKELLPALVESNAVTIRKLMELAPPGTLDPTPLLYTETMYGCAGLLGIGFVANALIRPVHHSHHMPPDRK
jgi:hypothetical protein